MKYFLKQTRPETKIGENINHLPLNSYSFLNGINITMKTFSPYHLNFARTNIFTIAQQIYVQNPSSLLNIPCICPNVQSSQINQHLYSNMTLQTPSLHPAYNNYLNPTLLGIVNPENTVKVSIRIGQNAPLTLFY